MEIMTINTAKIYKSRVKFDILIDDLFTLVNIITATKKIRNHNIR